MREKRANLIFISILFVLLLPGFFILMRKKLNGRTDPNYMPQPLPHAAAYMQPPPIPPTVPRVEPDEVRLWVKNQLQQRVNPDLSVARNQASTGPIIGDRFTTQIVHITPANVSPSAVYLLIWDTNAIDVEVRVGIGDHNAAFVRAETVAIDIPRDLRHTLQRVGYISPPMRVAWVKAQIDLSNTTLLHVQYNQIAETIRLDQ